MQGLQRFRASGCMIEVEGLRFRVKGLDSRVQRLWFQV